MKLRPFLITAVALASIIGMSSCSRNFTCRCTIKYSGVPGLPDSTSSEYTINDSKAHAQSLCEGGSYVTNQNGVHTEENCELF
ncbi:MAG: hypothetical protein JSS82_14895 [Bacteroidetes bacterium]|nr:hypothetical protein [Bacteroidota bacterium]